MKHQRLTALLLALVTIVSVMVVPVSALSSDVHDILFDWEYYYANNSDVAKAFGRNPDALRRHYDSHGKAEGRAPSVLFDPKVYLGLYNDLKNAFGTNYKAAYDHFVSNGISEGRQGSSHFSVAVYKANYADLQKAFGGNNLLYLKHFREFGAKEGREAVKNLPVSTPTSPFGTTSVKIRDGYYMITAGSFGWNVQYAPRTGIGNFVLDSIANRESNEIFYIQYVASKNAYYITPVYRQNEAAANALYGRDCKAGTQLKLHPSTPNDTASLWYITAEGNSYRFQNLASGLYVTIAGSTTTGTALTLQKKSMFQQTFGLTPVTVTSSSVPADGLLFPLKGSITRSSNLKTNGYYCDYKTGGSVPVYAPADGTVVYKQIIHNGKLVSYGNLIEFTSADGVYTIRMAHLNSFEGVNLQVPSTETKKKSASEVSGEYPVELAVKTVSRNQLLGYSGQTGNASGHHLHLEVLKNGKAVNPADVFKTWK